MRPNSTTKMLSAIQFTSCTTISPFLSRYSRPRCGARQWLLVVGGEVDNGREHGADDHPQELEPVKEGDAHQGGLDSVVQGRPERHGKLDHEEQIPPAPGAAFSGFTVHCDPPPLEAFSGPYPKGTAFVNSEGEAGTHCRSDVVVVVIGDTGAVRNGDGQTAADVGIRNAGIGVETLGEVMIRIERNLVEEARAGSAETGGRAG